MEDRVDRVLAEHASQKRTVGDIPHVEGDPGRHRLAMASGEVVHDDHRVPAFAQHINHHATDVAAAAGHEDGHPPSDSTRQEHDTHGANPQASCTIP